MTTPEHYDNSKGSLYKFAHDHNLNAWEFDIIKRIARSRKKGNFKEDLEKTKHVIDLYLEEYDKKSTVPMCDCIVHTYYEWEKKNNMCNECKKQIFA